VVVSAKPRREIRHRYPPEPPRLAATASRKPRRAERISRILRPDGLGREAPEPNAGAAPFGSKGAGIDVSISPRARPFETPFE
jgi:hypothetical protein